MAYIRSVLGGVAALVALPLALSGCSPSGGNPVPIPTVTVTAAPIEPDKPAEEPTESVDSDFTLVVDDSGVVSMSVPNDWTEVSGTSLTTSDGIELLNVTASPSLEAFQDSWEGPGASVSATQDPKATVEAFVASFEDTFTEECGDPEEGDYDDTVYRGTYVYFSGCGDTETDFLGVVAQDYDATHLVITTIQMTNDEEKSTIRDEILNTFYATY